MSDTKIVRNASGLVRAVGKFDALMMCIAAISIGVGQAFMSDYVQTVSPGVDLVLWLILGLFICLPSGFSMANSVLRLQGRAATIFSSAETLGLGSGCDELDLHDWCGIVLGVDADMERNLGGFGHTLGPGLIDQKSGDDRMGADSSPGPRTFSLLAPWFSLQSCWSCSCLTAGSSV